MPPERRRPRYAEEPEPQEAVGESADEAYDDVYDEEAAYEEPRARRPRRPLTAAAAAQAGLRHIAQLTSRDPEAVTLVAPREHGWVVDVEVLEDHRIPSSSDILAIYEIEMDDEGDLLSYRRTRRYRRGPVEFTEGSS
ncbi:hypothetical protein TBS_15440 [Thermobispora bispora]|uniref:gas vesicle protein GvpO n=1 Tax=Thermobispora bispora TaxID=2006 RepID=UPI0030E91A01